MRTTLEVKNKSVTESGIILVDIEGNTYHWVTKQHGHPLFFTNDFTMVRMTIADDVWGTGKIAKNVRLIKNI